jgi:hypothetical protein
VFALLTFEVKVACGRRGYSAERAQDKLRIAAKHVAAGLRRVAKQRAIIARLENNGSSTVGAVRMIELFEQKLAIFEEHYEDMLNEIANLCPP